MSPAILNIFPQDVMKKLLAGAQGVNYLKILTVPSISEWITIIESI